MAKFQKFINALFDFTWLLLLLLLLVHIYQIIVSKIVKRETFTSHIHSFYRPYVRKFNIEYENFTNKYGSQFIWNKIRKWNLL
jgi:hypothetical protein